MSRASSGSGPAGGEWRLFSDWCTTTGQDPLPAASDTVLAFLTDLPTAPAVAARRARSIRAAHTAAGLLPPTPSDRQPPKPLMSHTMGDRLRGPGLLTAGDALQVLPVFEQPAAVAARRDAVLVLLCLVMGRSRAEARRATAQLWPVPRLGGVDLPLGADPRSCPSCVLTRWLRVLAADSQGGRQLVQTTICDSDRVGHGCGHEICPGWHLRPLLPGVDRHGWIDTERALTPRAVSARLRQAVQAPAIRTTPHPGTADRRLTVGRRDRATLAELDQLLNRLETALCSEL